MNYKIVVDAGHGGVDPGAVSGNLQEKDFNLNSSLYMYDRFNELGIPVKLTRNTDETLPKNERIKRILNAFGNDEDVILISNHINAGGGDGAEVVYALRNDEELSKSILNNIAKEGQNVRSYYQRRLPSDPTKDYYFIHRETGNLEPVLVEYGFIDSSKDDVVQLKNNLDDYAEAVVKSVAGYINVPYFPPREEANVYIVEKGDNLYNISEKYGISVENLKNANGISGNLLTIGQKLAIPQDLDKIPGGYTIYTVKKGDSLWKIAKDYNISVNDIVDYNNLGTTTLIIGQQLLIPNLKKDVTTPDNLTYVVKSGDSLWSISKKYNIGVEELKKANNLTTNLLKIGQILTIPSTNQYKTYIVKSGDSLWKIAQNNNINVNDLIKINNFSSDLLKIGDQLLIP